MISFKLFLEKCQAPLEVLKKYKDDPNAFISFTNIIEPRAMQQGISPTSGPKSRADTTANKKTTRIGLNPLTSYDTPAGVYTYPVKAYWDYIEEYDIHFVKEMPYVYVLKPKNPDRCARASSYTEEDFNRDFAELKEIYPQYKLDKIIDAKHSHNELDGIYPGVNGYRIFISDRYRSSPLHLFWSITRSLATLIMHDLEEKETTNTKHITVWTHIMRRFYDGIIDDTGSSIIHGNEPFQAVFWTNAQFKIVDFIDRTCGNRKFERSEREWTGKDKHSNVFNNNKIYGIIDKAYMAGVPQKLNTGIKTILHKKGISEMYTRIIDGELTATDTHSFFTTNGLPKDYYELAIKLYLKHDKSNRKIFNDKNLYHDVAPYFLMDNAIKIAPRIQTTENSSAIASALAIVISNGYRPEYSDALVGLLRISNKNVVLANILNIDFSKLLRDPKLIGATVKMFERITRNKDNIINLNTVRDLISLLTSTKTKNKSIWRKFIPFFTNTIDEYQLNSYSYGEVVDILKLFLNAETGIEDELKDSMNNVSNKVPEHKTPLNNVWKMYFGVDLFRPALSQFDTIKKARHITATPPPTPTINTPKFNDGDVIVDGDGFYYNVISIGNDNTIMYVKDQDGDTLIIDPEEFENFILHDPKNPLYEGDEHLKVGDKVKVDGEKGIGTIIEYHPFKNYKYRVYVDGAKGDYKGYELTPVDETDTKKPDENSKVDTDTQVSLPPVDSKKLETNEGLMAGDKLKCVTPQPGRLTKGKTYVVESLIDEDMVKVEDDTGLFTEWYTERFIMAQPIPKVDHKYKVDQKVKMEIAGKYIVGKILELAPPAEYDKLKNRPRYKILWDEDQDISTEFEDSIQLVLPEKKLAHKVKYSLGDAFLTKDGKYKIQIKHVYASVYQFQKYHKNGPEWEKDGDVFNMYLKTFDNWMTNRLEVGTHIMDVKV